jgi:YggT family protein
MAGLLNASLYLINILFVAYLWVLILRVLLQWFRADPYNPISQIIAQLTRIPVSYLQQVIPRWRRLDVATCVYALLVSWIYVQILYAFLEQPIGGARGLWLAARHLVQQVLNLYSGSLFIYVLLSWFGAGMNNPAGAVLWSINEPLLRPVRRVIPPQAGLDFAPLIVIVLLQLAGIVMAST